MDFISKLKLFGDLTLNTIIKRTHKGNCDDNLELRSI